MLNFLTDLTMRGSQLKTVDAAAAPPSNGFDDIFAEVARQAEETLRVDLDDLAEPAGRSLPDGEQEVAEQPDASNAQENEILDHLDEAEGVLSRPDEAEGVLSRPDEAEGVLFRPDEAEGVLFRPDRAEGVLFRPDRAEGVLSRPNMAAPKKAVPDSIVHRERSPVAQDQILSVNSEATRSVVRPAQATAHFSTRQDLPVTDHPDQSKTALFRAEPALTDRIPDDQPKADHAPPSFSSIESRPLKRETSPAPVMRLDEAQEVRPFVQKDVDIRSRAEQPEQSARKEKIETKKADGKREDALSMPGQLPKKALGDAMIQQPVEASLRQHLAAAHHLAAAQRHTRIHHSTAKTRIDQEDKVNLSAFEKVKDTVATPAKLTGDPMIVTTKTARTEEHHAVLAQQGARPSQVTSERTTIKPPETQNVKQLAILSENVVQTAASDGVKKMTPEAEILPQTAPSLKRSVALPKAVPDRIEVVQRQMNPVPVPDRRTGVEQTSSRSLSSPVLQAEAGAFSTGKVTFEARNATDPNLSVRNTLRAENPKAKPTRAKTGPNNESALSVQSGALRSQIGEKPPLGANNTDQPAQTGQPALQPRRADSSAAQIFAVPEERGEFLDNMPKRRSGAPQVSEPTMSKTPAPPAQPTGPMPFASLASVQNQKPRLEDKAATPFTEVVEEKSTVGLGATEARSPSPSPVIHGPSQIRPDTASGVLRQVTEAIARLSDNVLDVQLSPEELGRVRMTLVSGEQGTIVHIHADRPETLDLLKRHIDQLARDLSAAGHDAKGFSFSDEKKQRQTNQTHLPGLDQDEGHAEPVIQQVAKDQTTGVDIRV